MQEIVTTVGKFLDAMEQSGYKQGFGHFYSLYFNTACAYGQALLNLGVDDPDNVYVSSLDNESIDVMNFIMSESIHLNDKERLPVDKIAKMIRDQLSPHTLDVEVSLVED